MANDHSDQSAASSVACDRCGNEDGPFTVGPITFGSPLLCESCLDDGAA